MIGKEAVHRKNGSYNTMAHRQVLKKAAEKSVILLKMIVNYCHLEIHIIRKLQS